MNESSKTLLKGLLLVIGLALSKKILVDPNEIDEAILMGAMTALTLLFSSDRLNNRVVDIIDAPANTKNTLNKIQSTLPRLTHKETEILSLMSRGLMNKQIAKKLGISDPAIKSYFNSVLRKLNTSLTSSPTLKAVKNSLVNAIHNLNPIYRKGASCCYKPILCQEGWCSECIIFRENVIGPGTSVRF